MEAAILIFAILPLALMLAMGFFYLLSLRRALELTRGFHSTFPDAVWLLFVPLLNVVWQFYLVIQVARGITGALGSKSILPAHDDGGRTVGLAMCVLWCCTIIPFLSAIAIIGGFICWLIYWYKLRAYIRLLEQHP